QSVNDSPRALSSHVVRKGVVANIVGVAVPALAALVAVPRLINSLGSSRFGALSLAWAFINAAGVLDLGIGRALTRFLAVQEEKDERREGAIIWTCLGIMTLVGSLGAALGVLSADQMASYFAHGDAPLRVETAAALRVLST